MTQRIHLDDVDSTNNYLKKALSETCLRGGTVVSTDFQTGGRGQRGNSWESNRGENLTFSMLLYPNSILANEQFIISQFTSLAIYDILSKYTDNISIKWPNDIYWNERKICGILIENALIEDYIQYSILGIGININQSEFKSNAPNPISLKQITGDTYNIEDIQNQVSDKILYYSNLVKYKKTEFITTNYKKVLFRNDGFYIYNDGMHNFEAKIKDVEPSGLFVLETKDGKIRKFAFKEVKYIL